MRLASLSAVFVSISLGNQAFGSLLTNGPSGIDSFFTGLDGSGVVIGQSEIGRSGKSDKDTDPLLHHDQVTPTQVYSGSAVSGANSLTITPHATQVAGVMIASGTGPDQFIEGVAPAAQLHSGGDALSGLGARQDSAINMNHKASINNMRAINLSFGFLLQDIIEIPDGNAFPSQFVDWSTSRHNVLYVAAADEKNLGRATPADNFNGITVGSSSRIDGMGDFLQSSSLNDTALDAIGSRTSIDILAPGTDLNLASLNNVTNTTSTGTSYAAPHVTGAVALLNQFATQRGFDSDAREPEVMKAILLNSADKLEGVHGSNRTVLDKNGNNWTNTQAFNSIVQPLDEEMGAGHLNVENAVTQFSGGEHGPGMVPLIGWDYGFVGAAGGSSDYEFNAPASGWLAATLTWNRRVELTNPDNNFNPGDTFFKYNDLDDVLVDLDLHLLPAGTDDLGQSIIQSITATDNTEHIFFNVQTAGNYKLKVRNDGGLFDAEEFGLAWWFDEAAAPILGDFDNDGDVDGNDLSQWQGDFGLNGNSDADFDGDSDGADFLAWQRNLTGSGAAAQGAWGGYFFTEGIPSETEQAGIEPIVPTTSAFSTSASFEVTTRPLTQAELDDGGASLEATDEVHEFFITADADILGFELTSIETADGVIYQHSFGSDTEPADPAFVAIFPALGVDSFITTPGDTLILGGGFDNTGEGTDIAWVDLTVDGAVTDFLFARLTTEGGIFEGTVTLRGTDGFETFPFSFSFGTYTNLTTIPEPGAMFLTVLSLPLFLATRNKW